jgi:membrane carboxypeptidase/penicillin-binding protein PbpC
VTYNWYYNTFYTPDIYQSYQWYDSAQGLIPGATSPSLAALENEYYWVVVTDADGCKGPSTRIRFDTHMLGVGSMQQAEVRVYPNPATETVNIESKVRVKAVLSSIDGRMLQQQADAKSLDVSKLAAGVYMLAVYDDSGQILTVQKVIKE